MKTPALAANMPQKTTEGGKSSIHDLLGGFGLPLLCRGIW